MMTPPTSVEAAAAASPGGARGTRLTPREAWYIPFAPLGWLRSAHGQTLAGNYWRRASFAIPFEPEAVVVDAADNSRVLCHGHWQADAVRAKRLTIVLVHGLEGSSDSRYIQGITARAWSAGCNVVRMNMRNCGGTENWTPTLYHSGLSADVAAVMRHFHAKFGLERMAMVGYSMGGNLVLKLAGELADAAPDWLLAAVAVSPAADLSTCAYALHEPRNRVYEWHFLRNLMRRFYRKAALFPQIYSTHFASPIRSLREFDDRITAPYSGFAGADDYYDRASAARVVERVEIPTLVLHALDDPFIRITEATRSRLRGNASIELIETSQGGHCAFLASTPEGQPDGARHWAEATLVRFLMATAGHADGV